MDTLYKISLAILSFGFFSYIILYLIRSVVTDFLEFNKIRRFKEDLRVAIKNSKPDWESVQDLAIVEQIGQSKVNQVCLELKGEAIKGNSELESYLDLIQSYLNSYKKDIPFDGIPEDIKPLLENLQKELKNESLAPLTIKIKELLEYGRKEKRWAKFFTIGGFIIGLAGLLVGLFTGIFPKFI